ncbi:MAG: argininosuccinate lyase [Deltaproteobacteria bacterium]|jgi:argininosuccinate lyase|nr:argininosuccinate lyase [Deltaproteobacteria bacterium]
MEKKGPKADDPKSPAPEAGARHLSGPLKEEMDPFLAEASVSVGFDQKLAYVDILGSLAHSAMLAKIGILSPEEHKNVEKALLDMFSEVLGERPQTFKWQDSLEDVHMNIESELIKRVGEAGEKLHTARSRNDQVALDELLYLRSKSHFLRRSLIELRSALVLRASEVPNSPMPGYTHMQRAQPVLLAHHLLAYYQIFTRDFIRFGFHLENLDSMPLGAGALAGTSIPIAPEMVASELGFVRLAENSLDAVSSRDKVLEFLSLGAILAVNLSRLAQELVLWSSSEFGFISFPDSLCTTSSMMPHKRNPDGAELVRGKSGRVIGNLVTVLTMVKGLPLSYNRDLQEDKEPLFDTAETLGVCVNLTVNMVKGIKFNLESMREAADDPYVGATDIADSLVLKGVPFRKAHHQVGALVQYAMEEKKGLRDLTHEELLRFCPLADPLILTRLNTESLIKSRDTSPGATAPLRVSERLEEAKKAIEEDKKATEHDFIRTNY